MLELSSPVDMPNPDILNFVSKKKSIHALMEPIMRPLIKKSSQERLKKRILKILSSVAFSQFGYVKSDVERYKELMCDSEVCLLFFYFEQLIKVFAVDPLNTKHEEFVGVAQFLEILQDGTELTLANETKECVITLTSTSLLHLWIQLASKIYRLSDNVINIEILMKKKLDHLVRCFKIERDFANRILPSESVSEVIYREIGFIQEVFLFVRHHTALEYEVLLRVMLVYLEAASIEIDPRVVKFQLILSMIERKTEFQPVHGKDDSIKVDLPEFIEFMVRMAWLLHKSSTQVITLETMYSPNSKKNFSDSGATYNPTNVQKVAEKLGTLIHGVRTFLLPEVEKLGLKELHQNLFICTR